MISIKRILAYHLLSASAVLLYQSLLHHLHPSTAPLFRLCALAALLPPLLALPAAPRHSRTPIQAAGARAYAALALAALVGAGRAAELFNGTYRRDPGRGGLAPRLFVHYQMACAAVYYLERLQGPRRRRWRGERWVLPEASEYLRPGEAERREFAEWLHGPLYVLVSAAVYSGPDRIRVMFDGPFWGKLPQEVFRAFLWHKTFNHLLVAVERGLNRVAIGVERWLRGLPREEEEYEKSSRTGGGRGLIDSDIRTHFHKI